MKNVFILIFVIGLILVGCGKGQVNKNAGEKTKTQQHKRFIVVHGMVKP